MNIFEVKDKTGRVIRLTQTQWIHICEHAEMVNEVENIITTIENPDKMIESPRDVSLHYYFRYWKLQRSYLLVAVKYLNGEGFVVTAFYSTKLSI